MRCEIRGSLVSHFFYSFFFVNLLFTFLYLSINVYFCLIVIYKVIDCMRYLKFVCFLLIATLAFPIWGKQPKDKKKYGVYLAGVSASFTDSLVYFTDVQYVDSASLGEKGLLEGRAQYSIQLKEYLEEKENGKNRTCFIYFNKNRKNLGKEMRKLRQRYQKGNTLVIREVNPDFKFEKADLY